MHVAREVRLAVLLPLEGEERLHNLLHPSGATLVACAHNRVSYGRPSVSGEMKPRLRTNKHDMRGGGRGCEGACAGVCAAVADSCGKFEAQIVKLATITRSDKRLATGAPFTEKDMHHAHAHAYPGVDTCAGTKILPVAAVDVMVQAFHHGLLGKRERGGHGDLGASDVPLHGQSEIGNGGTRTSFRWRI
jgi:hypothetical protein